MALKMKNYTKKIKITKKIINKFRSLTNDNNPVHTQQKMAEKYGYKPIVYGFLSASFLSSIIGNRLPGPGSVWLDVNIKFNNPVFEGDTIIIHTKILKFFNSSNIVQLESTIKNQDDQTILVSESTVKAPKNFFHKNSKIKTSKKKINYKNKKNTLLIIGSSSKLTKSLVNKIKKKYQRIIFIYNKSKLKLKDKKFKHFQYDLTKKNDYKKLINYINQNNCSINSVVFIASEQIIFKDFFSFKREEILNHFNIQVLGFYDILKSCKKSIFGKKGSIVFIGSEVLNSKPPKKMLPYTIGKHSLYGFFRCLAEEFGSDGIRINMVSPGIIEEISNNFPEISKEMFKTNSTLGTLVKIDNVSNMIKFLLSDESQNITGQNLRVNSGYSFN